MFGEVRGIVAAGVEVVLVRYVPAGENLVEGSSAGFETVVVAIAAIEIDSQAGEIRGASHRDGTVAIPENRIGRSAEDLAENAGTRRIRSRAEKFWKLLDKGRTVRRHRNEELRMRKGQVQCAVAAHRDARDGTMRAAGSDAIPFFDDGKELLQKEVFVACFAVLGVNVEGRIAFGGGNEEVAQFAFFAHVFDEVECAGVDEGLLIIAETVKKVEYRKLPGFLLVERGGKDYAVADGSREDFAGEGIALDTAGSGGGGEWGRENPQQQHSQAELIHSAGRRQG